MPRRRRRMGLRTSRKSRRSKADWVYRGNSRVVGTGVAGNDLNGTYEGVITTLAPSPSQAQSRILYDSRNYFGDLTRAGMGTAGSLGTAGVLPRAARAEGSKATILAVEGFIYLEATAWALGNLIALGVRMGAFEQDLTGVVSVDANYSMWVDETVFPRTSVASYANNGRTNAREWRRHHFFTSTTPSAMIMPIKWRGRRVLQGNECWALYLELETTSVSARSQFWLRTLVSDEG